MGLVLAKVIRLCVTSCLKCLQKILSLWKGRVMLSSAEEKLPRKFERKRRCFSSRIYVERSNHDIQCQNADSLQVQYHGSPPTKSLTILYCRRGNPRKFRRGNRNVITRDLAAATSELRISTAFYIVGALCLQWGCGHHFLRARSITAASNSLNDSNLR